MSTIRRINLFCTVGYLALSVLLMFLYWPGLSGGFFFDDIPNILVPQEMQIKDLSLDSLRGVIDSGKAGPLKRPVSTLSFSLNYYFSGFDAFAFKLTNLFIHVFCTPLVFFLSVLLLRVSRLTFKDSHRLLLSGAGALLWSVHPIQVTSVLYVVQRMTSLSSLFVLAGLILHIWARQRPQLGRVEVAGYLVAWCLCFPLAVLSKETAVLFILYVLAYELILQPNYRGKIDSFSRWYGWSVFAGGLLALAYVWVPSSSLLAGYETRSFSMEERLLTEARIIWEYLGLVLLPSLPSFGLYHDDFSLSRGLGDPPTTGLAIIGLASLLACIWGFRKRLPLVSFGLAWFLLGHTLESTIFPLELMHEHRNYLPSLGIVIMLVSIPSYFVPARKEMRVVSVGLLVGFVLYIGLLTHMRADMYRDNFRRTQIEAQFHPDSVRSQYDAGAVLANLFAAQNSPVLASMATTHFDIVKKLDPDFKLGLIGRLQLSCLIDQSTPEDVVSDLRSRLAHGRWIRQDRDVMRAISEMSNIGSLCLERRQVDELFQAAFNNPRAKIADRSVMLSDYAAYLWLGQKDYAAARDALYRAISDNHNDSLNRLNLLQLLRLLGDHQGVAMLIAELEGMKLNVSEQQFLQNVKNSMAEEKRERDKSGPN